MDSLDDQPLGYRVNIFLARLCFRGIYFPMMGRLAWVKVIAQNRRTILSLVGEALWGRGGNPDSPHPVPAMLSSVPAEAATSEEG